jgi:hypothetical protein
VPLRPINAEIARRSLDVLKLSLSTLRNRLLQTPEGARTPTQQRIISSIEKLLRTPSTQFKEISQVKLIELKAQVKTLEGFLKQYEKRELTPGEKKELAEVRQDLVKDLAGAKREAPAQTSG